MTAAVTVAAVVLFVVILVSVVVAFVSTVRIGLTGCGISTRPLFVLAAAVVVGAVSSALRCLLLVS